MWIKLSLFYLWGFCFLFFFCGGGHCDTLFDASITAGSFKLNPFVSASQELFLSALGCNPSRISRLSVAAESAGAIWRCHFSLWKYEMSMFLKHPTFAAQSATADWSMPDISLACRLVKICTQLCFKDWVIQRGDRSRMNWMFDPCE